MFNGKKSWFLMILTTAILVAIPNANAADLFNNGDMEAGGGSPTVIPDSWVGTGGVTGSSTDVPVAGGVQSLSITASTYLDSWATGTSNPVTENTDYELSFWHKGNVRTQSIHASGITEHLENEYVWKKVTRIITTLPGVTEVGLTFYDLDYTDGLPLLVDNVSLTTNPAPPVVNLFSFNPQNHGSNMEGGGGSPTIPPDYWGGGSSGTGGVRGSSTDTPFDNGAAQSLSI